MRQLFNLRITPARSRADIDAFLELDGTTYNFELKSTTRQSFSTVRDFGPDHLAKWRDDLHWIFAVYGSDLALKYCYYASPIDMEPWFAEKERYIAPDLALRDALPMHVTYRQVFDALGEKQTYSLAEARRIMKSQWRKDDYKRYQDLPGGFSLEQMTELMRKRAWYLLNRGSTLNNPHVPMSYFSSFERITVEHAAKLRELVRAYASGSRSEHATA